MNGTQKQVELAIKMVKDVEEFLKTIEVKEDLKSEWNGFIAGEDSLVSQMGDNAGSIISNAQNWANALKESFDYFATITCKKSKNGKLIFNLGTYEYKMFI